MFTPTGVLVTRLLTNIAPPLIVVTLTTAARVVQNIGANQKVAGSLVRHCEKVVESQVSVKVSNGIPNHDIGREPDFALATALANIGTNLQSRGS